MKRSQEMFVTETDRERLQNLIQLVRAGNGDAESHDVKLLEEGLESADVVLSQEIPADIVTMRSKVKLEDVDSGDRSTYSIVFPTEADPESGRISILAPLASAVLGRRVGEIVEFQAPSRLRRIRLEKMLYQPESAGDYSL